jgi:hypothetical protein
MKPRHLNRLSVKRIARLKAGKYVDGGGLFLPPWKNSRSIHPAGRYCGPPFRLVCWFC